jgi:hypothetical protein
LKLSYLTPLLGAAAAGIAIIVAPIAAAAAPAGPGAAQQSCIPSASGTVCQSPGNAEINDPPPPVSFYPYGATLFCSAATAADSTGAAATDNGQ